MASARSCEAADFCSEFAGAPDVSFSRVYEGSPRSRLIAQRDGLRLIADMSPLVVGHMLLLPVEHQLSFAAVLSQQQAAVNRIMSWLRPRYVRAFDRLAVLEHGSSSELYRNACITHAHWHIVPLDAADLREIIIADGLRPVILSRLSNLTESPWSENPYFYVSDGDEHALFDPTEAQPRQYLRSVMGRALSMVDPEWDYAVVVRKELLRSTMRITESWVEAP